MNEFVNTSRAPEHVQVAHAKLEGVSLHATGRHATDPTKPPHTDIQILHIIKKDVIFFDGPDAPTTPQEVLELD